ncbi:hypothetical protein G6F57_020144 [Rhizopus arrhizus]|nr:hypothetical protein G6F57_020144 [Rhizopus arrhizus]
MLSIWTVALCELLVVYGRRAGQRCGRAAAIHVAPLAAVPALQRPGELVARRVVAGGHVERHLAICVDRECRAGCRGVRAARGVDDLQRAVAARNRTAAARAGGGPAGHVAPTAVPPPPVLSNTRRISAFTPGPMPMALTWLMLANGL